MAFRVAELPNGGWQTEEWGVGMAVQEIGDVKYGDLHGEPGWTPVPTGEWPDPLKVAMSQPPISEKFARQLGIPAEDLVIEPSRWDAQKGSVDLARL